MICAVHKKEMKQNARGWYCPTPITKSADGKTVLEWCLWKPNTSEPNFSDGVPVPPEPPVTTQSINDAPLKQTTTSDSNSPDWQQIGRVKAMCGMVNARLQSKTPAEVLTEVPYLRQLLRHMEAEASRE